MRLSPSLVVLVVLSWGVLPAAAQVPVPEALLRATRVVLIKGPYVEQARLDRVAREITNWRGAPQWELVPQGAEADLVIGLTYESESGGSVVTPYPFGIFSTPLEANTYELTVVDAARLRALGPDATEAMVILWQNRRRVHTFHGGAVADLTKDLLTRVRDAQAVASVAARPVAPVQPPPGTLTEWAASVATPSQRAAPASDEPSEIEMALCFEYLRDRQDSAERPDSAAAVAAALLREGWIRGYIMGLAIGYVAHSTVLFTTAHEKATRLQTVLDRLEDDANPGALAARITRLCADRLDERLYDVAQDVVAEAARHLTRP